MTVQVQPPDEWAGRPGERVGHTAAPLATCGGRSQALGDSTEPALDIERGGHGLPRPVPPRPSGLDSEDV